MSYANQAALFVDEAFTARLSACLCEQAQVIGADPGGDQLATTILRNPAAGTDMFLPFIATAPGFADAYGDAQDQTAITDGMLLSAVQASWPAVSAANTPPDPTG